VGLCLTPSHFRTAEVLGSLGHQPLTYASPRGDSRARLRWAR
jgi:hypothetical protein